MRTPTIRQKDAIQSILGKPILQYIEDWVQGNLNSSNTEVQALAQQLYASYGDTGAGKLSFDHDIGDESVIGGSLSGTYISIHDDASTAVAEIQLLETLAPGTYTQLPTTPPPPPPPPTPPVDPPPNPPIDPPPPGGGGGGGGGQEQ
jgi:hypothetical protein